MILVEHPRQDPQIVQTGIRSHADANAYALRWAEEYAAHKGTRILVRSAHGASTDQLQVYAHDRRAIRDQPHLIAVGEDVTVHVPAAVATIHPDPKD